MLKLRRTEEVIAVVQLRGVLGHPVFHLLEVFRHLLGRLARQPGDIDRCLAKWHKGVSGEFAGRHQCGKRIAGRSNLMSSTASYCLRHRVELARCDAGKVPRQLQRLSKRVRLFRPFDRRICKSAYRSHATESSNPETAKK